MSRAVSPAAASRSGAVSVSRQGSPSWHRASPLMSQRWLRGSDTRVPSLPVLSRVRAGPDEVMAGTGSDVCRRAHGRGQKDELELWELSHFLFSQAGRPEAKSSGWGSGLQSPLQPACTWLNLLPSVPAADSGPLGPGPGAEQQLHRVRRREGHVSSSRWSQLCLY